MKFLIKQILISVISLVSTLGIYEGYFANKATTIPDVEIVVKDSIKPKPIVIDTLEPPEIESENILFEFGKAILKSSSEEELDKVVKYMLNDEEVKVKISGHTDNQGDFQANINLSRRRALAVVEYLKGKDIDENRLTYEGYGSKDPIEDNNTEIGRAKNRRVEFEFF